MKKLIQPFYQVCLFLLNLIPKNWKQQREKKIGETLRKVYPGRKHIEEREFYAGCLAVGMAVLFWGIGMILLAGIVQEQGSTENKMEKLTRPGYGEESAETELLVSVEGEEETAAITIEVGQQKYTESEIRKIFEELGEQMEETIKGENESLDEVRENLTLPSALKEDSIEVSWEITPSDLLDDTGEILREVKPEGELVQLKAWMKYRNYDSEYTCYAKVFPRERTSIEYVVSRIKEEIAKTEEKGTCQKELLLPDEIDGKRITFHEQKEHTKEILLILLLISAGALVWREYDKLKKLEKERERQLVMDYPELLFKLSMLIGAGLTIKGAFEKIAEEYIKKENHKLHYVYEEMVVTCMEMHHGTGEALAYEQFGKRCGAGYMKLGSVLSQNLKKGAKGLQELLEKEAEAGFEQRKNMARKLGEEAGTKLLFPMILMMMMIMAILMVPAILTF